MSDRHPITIVKNGIETRLDSLAHGIVTKSGIHIMAGSKEADADIPGRTGTVYRPGKRRGPGSIYLQMYVQECDDLGYVPEDSYPQFLANLDRLFRLFNTRFSEITIREYLDDIPSVLIGEGITPDPFYAGLYSTSGLISAGTGLYEPSAGMSLVDTGLYSLPVGALDAYDYREAVCKVDMMVTPELRGRYWSQFAVECIISSGSWTEKTSHTITAGTTTGTFTLDELDGTTDDIEDAVICVDGPITNPKITDPYTGHYVQLTSFALAAGQQWVVDCANWESVTGSGLDFTTVGGTNRIAQTVSSGPFAPRLFGIAAGSPPAITLSGTGTGAGTRIRVKAKRRFL